VAREAWNCRFNGQQNAYLRNDFGVEAKAG